MFCLLGYDFSVDFLFYSSHILVQIENICFHVGTVGDCSAVETGTMMKISPGLNCSIPYKVRYVCFLIHVLEYSQ